MIIPIPGLDVKVRMAERVETVDNQYDIIDFGAQHADGSIDSLAVGGSFASLKSLATKLDERKDKRNAEAAAAEDSVCVEAEAVAGS